MISFPLKQGLFQYDLMDHYAILGASLDATPQQIRQAYLKVAYRLHPDTCKVASEGDKKLAAKLFSKLVNPAYEALSRETSRTEYLLIASQTARNVKDEAEKIARLNANTQKLWAAKNNPELVYRQILQPLTQDLYSGDLSQIFPKIAQISELNLVFLLLKGEQKTRVRPPAQAQPRGTVVQSTPLEASGTVEAPAAPPPAPKLSPQEAHLRRANEYFDKNQFNQAISELRELLKLEPKNAEAHCLLGLSYLKSKMLTMAKVHIKTAWELDPSNPRILMAKRELDKQSTAGASQSENKTTSKGTFLGGLFGGGGKKK
ncbi:MAG: tetratricopeptide repeat protein [Cyanobacteriota bacterium]|nr:tetratricopeptide repeat protein [Cyanobacteriota bacterium]